MESNSVKDAKFQKIVQILVVLAAAAAGFGGGINAPLPEDPPEAPCRCDELTYTPSLQEVGSDFDESEQPDEAYFVHIPLPTAADPEPDNFLTDLFEEPFVRPVDKTRYRN